MTTDTNACETPLLDLLRSVPLDARDLYSHGGPFETRSIPYGRHCHAAAAEIARLQAQVDALAVALREALASQERWGLTKRRTNAYAAARAALAAAGR